MYTAGETHADILRKELYSQNITKPKYGNTSDYYSPDMTTSIDNVCRQITKKTKVQVDRIVLNLDDLKRLNELIVIKDGSVDTWYVR